MSKPEKVGPAARRRQLAQRLRELRVAAGFTTMESAASGTGLSRATISRIEAAKQVILPRTVRLLCQVYGTGKPVQEQLVALAVEAEERGWSTDHADLVPSWAQRYVAEEADASEVCAYEADLVPALLRTDDYQRAVRAAHGPDVTEDDIARSLRLCAARRQRLVGRHPQRLTVVLDEAVLHRQVGGPHVWRAQLRHLLAQAERPTITVQVLPFTVGAHPAVAGSFTMLHFPAGIGVSTIYVQTDSAGLYPDRPADHVRYNWMFDRLRELALSPQDSLALLRGMVD